MAFDLIQNRLSCPYVTSRQCIVELLSLYLNLVNGSFQHLSDFGHSVLDDPGVQLAVSHQPWVANVSHPGSHGNVCGCQGTVAKHTGLAVQLITYTIRADRDVWSFL